MAKTYKLWIEIDEYDDKTGEYKNITRSGRAEPVPLGVVSSLHMAVQKAESLYDCFGGLEEPDGPA